MLSALDFSILSGILCYTALIRSPLRKSDVEEFGFGYEPIACGSRVGMGVHVCRSKDNLQRWSLPPPLLEAGSHLLLYTPV